MVEKSLTLEQTFGNAFIKVAKDHGYTTGLALACLLSISISTIHRWKKGAVAPSPINMGKILENLYPTDEEIESLINPWSQLLQAGKCNIGMVAGSEVILKVARKKRIEPENALCRWMFDTADALRISLTEEEAKIGFSDCNRRWGKRECFPSVATLGLFLEKVENNLQLTGIQKEKLGDAVAETINEAIQAGKLRQSSPGLARNLQKEIVCTTFTGVEAGLKLGVSRQRIFELKGKMGIKSMLLSESDVNGMKARLERNRRESQEI